MWLAFVLKRLLSGIPTIVGILTVVFLFVRLVPGDPAQAILGEYATPANVAAMRESLGLDRPLVEQYVSFMSGALRFDFGRSFQTRQLVSERIFDALPYTLSLGLAALAVALLVGVPAGIVAARRRNSALDYGVTVAALTMYLPPPAGRDTAPPGLGPPLRSPWRTGSRRCRRRSRP